MNVKLIPEELRNKYRFDGGSIKIVQMSPYSIKGFFALTALDEQQFSCECQVVPVGGFHN